MKPSTTALRNATTSATATAAARDAQIITALCAWFTRHARGLPWRKRRRRTGYGALVSESMLQQTQVTRVIERYEIFLQRFPNVRALASASEQDVLAHWQGLGYYRRARNLHAAAKMIVREFGGRVPRTAEKLHTLPGVGRYTAGAIASIVFGEAAPIVDGNVRRVLSRWAAKRGLNEKQLTAWAWKMAEDFVQSAAQPGVFNEALMELGAMICTPRSPKCGECPVAKFCRARRLNLQDRIPPPLIRAEPQAAHHHAVIVSRNGKILVERRGDDGMWAGMWQTPTIERDSPLDLTEVKMALRTSVTEIVKRGTFEHHTTHRRICFHVYHARTNARRGRWLDWHALDSLPMSNAQRRVLAMAKEMRWQ